MILFVAGIFIGSTVGCNCNVHFTGEQKVRWRKQKMETVDITIRNKKKEVKRYETYLKKLGKKKGEQKK